jgi:hypothetical protein
MNQAAAVILLVTLSMPALADRDLCKRIAHAAANIMELRQSGIEQHEMRRFAGENQLLQKLINQAYEVRQHANNERRAKEVMGFGLRRHLACYMMTRKKMSL